LRILNDPMMAEEATQDTFLKLWNRAHLYLAERGSLLPWLLTIARRVALDVCGSKPAVRCFLMQTIRREVAKHSGWEYPFR